MKLVDKHFPHHHKFNKIFNRNTIKVSYSCMDNMESMIHKHNAKILNPLPENTGNMCSCREKYSCPLNGNCLKRKKSCIKQQCHQKALPKFTLALQQQISKPDTIITQIHSDIAINLTVRNFLNIFGSLKTILNNIVFLGLSLQMLHRTLVVVDDVTCVSQRK